MSLEGWTSFYPPAEKQAGSGQTKMPIILSENEATESGIAYADQTGVSYEFPRMYQKIIRSGETFIYYQGRKRKVGRQPQVYFGTGQIGEVKAASTSDERLSCEILDFVRFAKPVPFKDGSNSYLEHGGSRRGYFQQGVRTISTT